PSLATLNIPTVWFNNPNVSYSKANLGEELLKFEIPRYTEWVRSTEAGSFHCDDTGLICEVKEAVTLTYYFDSWPKLLEEQNTEELHVAGPLLNFKVDAAEAVASICIPHFLCLEGEDSSHVYIAHFVEGEMRLEKPDRVEPHHAVLENPKFSSLGVVFKKWFKQKINTVVLLYHRLHLETPTFHLYLLPNDPSIIKVTRNLHLWYSRLPGSFA
uniref:FIIND domain-containing protein n=1 Tax=Podarcis muralis TaxID=64176 RepID=A0A670JI21_PODMU